MKVAIDIGHANRTGACGNGYEEHYVCAVLAGKVKGFLESYRLKAEVIDFPERDNNGDLAATVRAINAGGYDVSVSLHMDWDDDPRSHGAHVCYCSAKGKRLADEIAGRLCPQMPGRAEKTVRRPGLYVLRETRPVAVLVECGFISNEGDAEWVHAHADEVARAIALGIAAYKED